MNRRNAFRYIALLIVAAAVVWLIVQWLPPGHVPDYPPQFQADLGVWVGIEWAMEPKSASDIEQLVSDLLSQGVTDAFFYVSYLKQDGTFNPTYDHAAEFVRQFSTAAPTIRAWGWVGVPIQGEIDGEAVENRLENAEIRRVVADFGGTIVENLGFYGLHLDAEMAASDDPYYVDTLDLIRSALPADGKLSVATHALRVTEAVTSIPYPAQAHHWTPAYLSTVANATDQVVVMVYDSGLFTPADYRNWTAYQVRSTVDTLSAVDTHVLVGLPISEEWTPSHHPYAENLSNGLLGLRIGLSQVSLPARLDGIALYPHWELSEEEWALVEHMTRAD